MNVIETTLPGVLIIEPAIFGDDRGFFKETFQAQRYRELGISQDFVQDNYSRSSYGVLRGLHFQQQYPQGKLVSCTHGSVFDVIVDIDPASATFTQHVSIEISGENHRQVYIPPGYAHGFCVLSDTADFMYKCTDYYRPDDEAGILWNDPQIDIAWPIIHPTLSPKDTVNMTLDAYQASL